MIFRVVQGYLVQPFLCPSLRWRGSYGLYFYLARGGTNANGTDFPLTYSNTCSYNRIINWEDTYGKRKQRTEKGIYGN